MTATNTATGAVAKTETNDEGYYRLPYLPPGNYTVAADKAGFATARVTDIVLRVGLTATINLTLRTGTGTRRGDRHGQRGAARRAKLDDRICVG